MFPGRYLSNSCDSLTTLGSQLMASRTRTSTANPPRGSHCFHHSSGTTKPDHRLPLRKFSLTDLGSKKVRYYQKGHHQGLAFEISGGLSFFTSRICDPSTRDRYKNGVLGILSKGLAKHIVQLRTTIWVETDLTSKLLDTSSAPLLHRSSIIITLLSGFRCSEPLPHDFPM